MKKRILTSIILAATLALGALTGCGNASAGSASDKTIKVGATPVPHAEILNNIVKEVLAEDGWTLETVVFSDYVLPNTSLEQGEIDANYFQTLGYMNQQNKQDCQYPYFINIKDSVF